MPDQVRHDSTERMTADKLDDDGRKMIWAFEKVGFM
jgi:hypothetical protein